MRWTRIGPSCAFLAFVISFSASGRSALALASVVTIASAANSDAARLAIIRRWWAASPPKRLDLRGVGISVVPYVFRGVSAAQRQAALVELLLDFVEVLDRQVEVGRA